jgi:site-specific DNA-methyltransferase (adenine-specific)
MQLIDITRIELRERQRRSFPPSAQLELKESILRNGLLQPPGGYYDETTSTWVLVYGERRLRAIQSLQTDERSFTYDGQTIIPGQLPILTITDVAAINVVESELAENIFRLDLDWQDRARALAKIHELRQAANPSQTPTDTAKEITTKVAGGNEAYVRQRISEAVTIVKHLDDESVSKARNAKEAHGLILKKEEERLHSIIARRSLARGTVSTDLEVRHGDMLEVLPLLASETFDLILTDPPYGINAGSAGFRSRAIHHHNYADTAEGAMEIARAILTEGFRLCKPRANLFLFCNPRLWNWLHDSAANMGWSPFPVPIIWQKSESEGLAPWGGSGFRRTYDTIFYATKGRKGLITSPVDIINVKRVPRHERIHAAEKPVELLRRLIEISTLPGDNVLDPCCGSGSTLVAARETRRKALGIEFDASYYDTALANLHGGKNVDTDSSKLRDNGVPDQTSLL